MGRLVNAAPTAAIAAWINQFGSSPIDSSDPVSFSQTDPSFDCTKSVNEVEEAICSNNELSALDENLSIQFKKLLARTQKPKTLIEEQKTWIKKDRNVCEDLPCLKNAYVSRIASLNDKFKTSSACPITEQALIGTWKGAEFSDFEEMAFVLDGERRSFLSWRHGHQEMIGNWKFRDCVIYITHSDNAKLSFG